MRAIIRFFKSLALFEIAKGMLLTMKYMLSPKITVQYPEEKTPLSPRFRGMHALRRYPDKKERCIACKLCASVCPAAAIKIESTEKEDKTRRASRYDINQCKCIFCGMCEEACPVGAIVQTHLFEYTGDEKSDLYFTKEMLLAVGEKYEKEIAKAKDAPYC